MRRIHRFFILFVLLSFPLFAQNTIDVVMEGISDGVRNTKQRDRDEAIMDAKLKVIEKAGVEISSATTVENFQLKKDWIESKAKACILPGFTIIETGYGVDGLYHVVLSGKVTATGGGAQVSPDNPAGIEFVFVKGGTFDMGSNDGFNNEKPVHSVTVSDFYMAKTEVTVAQYRVFCSATGCPMPPAPSWGWIEDHPIVNVSWNDARVFCGWSGGRLPTEAEWEYAAKGGNQSVGFQYSGSDNIDEVAWYSANAGGETHPVETKAANVLGLFDMSGNVWEWCSDCYDANYYSTNPSMNPRGPASGTTRVLRGGSCSGDAEFCRCANRGWLNPDLMSYYYGFRPVRIL